MTTVRYNVLEYAYVKYMYMLHRSVSLTTIFKAAQL